MKITDIRVDGFGVWNTMTVDQLSEGITLFYGPNEAGKTTLMQFVRAILYGFSPERRKVYLPPVFGGVPGGMLRVQNHSGEFLVERRESDKDPDGSGRVVVLASNGSRQGQHLLNVLISGVDEAIFNNVFAIGIRELQELATLNDTQAAEQLYNLASGVDRVSLVEVMRHLESSRRKIWDAEAETGDTELGQLLVRRGKLAAEVELLQRQTRRWSDLATQRRTLVSEVEELDDRIKTLKHDLRTVEVSIQVRDPWLARREVARQLRQIGHVEPLPEDSLERLEGLNEKIASQRENLKPLRKRQQELRRELAAQPINRSLWDQSSRIEAVCEHGPWIAALEEEIKGLTTDVESAEMELIRHEETLVATGAPSLAGDVVVTSKMMQQLQPAAQSVKEASRKRSIARKVQKKSRQDVDEAAAEIEDELAGRNFEDFEEALEHSAVVVKQLRRRVELEDQLESMNRNLRELNEEYGEVLDNQFQRVRILAGIGGMFVFGFVMTLTGMFGWNIIPMSAEVCWGVSLLGMICIALSVAWKMVLERTAQEEIEDAQSRQDGLQDEIEVLAGERNDLDRELPTDRGTLASRLTKAEKELRDLEEMAPLQLERERAEKRKKETSRHHHGADDEMKEARARWRRALRAAGLPETLTAKHVRQLGAHHQKKAQIETRLDEKKARLEKLTADRNALVARLDQLNEDVGMSGISNDPHIQISQLATALSGQRDMVQQRRELQKEERAIRRELSQHLRALRRMDRAREAIFSEARVTDEEQLRDRAEQLAEVAELELKQEAYNEQVVGIIAQHCEEEEIAAVLQSQSKEELQQRRELLGTRLTDTQQHLSQLHQQHGEIKQEMKALAENRRLTTARFELGCVESRLDAVCREWRTLAATVRLLESIRESYEAERQPETLSEASIFLERLTAGKYTRIWTPMGNDELRIDNQHGEPMPLDVLSRGTREAVFLSLRMALVAAYGRRGVSIPMVLDDVLVNLDAKRAEAAVELLCDFAREGRQLLFFTCHEHIKAMFMAVGVDTRVLPVHGTPGVHVVPLLEAPAPPPVVEEEEFEEEEEEVHAEVEEEEFELDDTELEAEADLEVEEEEEVEAELDLAEDDEEEELDLAEPIGEAEEELEFAYINETPLEEEPVVAETPIETYYELEVEEEVQVEPPPPMAEVGDYQLEEADEPTRHLDLLQYLAELEASAAEAREESEEIEAVVPEDEEDLVEVAETPVEPEPAEVDGVSDDLDDDDAFSDGAWWWEAPRRSLEEEEETAA